MKPGHILHLIDSGGMYGAEKVIIALMIETRRKGLSVSLGCFENQDSERSQIARTAESLGFPVDSFLMRNCLNPLEKNQFARYLLDRNVSLVHSHGYKPNVYLSFLQSNKIPVISTAHGWANNTAGLKMRVYESLDRLALRKMHRVIAVSNSLRDHLVTLGIRHDRITVIQNGITLEERSFGAKDQIRDSFQIPRDSFLIGTVGRLTEVKGHVYLIRAMAEALPQIPNCFLAVAGEGPLREPLENEAARLGVSHAVRLLGFVPDIGRFLSGIDLFVLPSLSEGLPISLLEAMLSRKPVLASAVGGVREVISNSQSGELIQPADPQTIANSIIRMYRDPEKRNQIAGQGQLLAREKFSAERMAAQYLELYSRVVHEK